MASGQVRCQRRIGAVTLGHVPPPMRDSETPDRLVRLESLLDEFSNADGLDPRRRNRLQDDIRAEAQALGVEEDLGLDQASCSAEAITRIQLNKHILTALRPRNPKNNPCLMRLTDAGLRPGRRAPPIADVLMCCQQGGTCLQPIPALFPPARLMPKV